MVVAACGKMESRQETESRQAMESWKWKAHLPLQPQGFAGAAAVLAICLAWRSGFALFVTFFVSLFAAIAHFGSKLPAMLGLGANARAVLIFDAADVSFSLAFQDLDLRTGGMVGDIISGSLPVHMAFHHLTVRELRLALRPVAVLIELVVVGLEFSMRVTEPHEWDAEKARRFAEGFTNWTLDMAFDALRDLANEEFPDKLGRVPHLIDAVISRSAIRAESWAVELVAAPKVGALPACVTSREPASLQISWDTLIMPPAVACEADPTMWHRDCEIKRFAIVTHASTSTADASPERRTRVGYFVGPIDRMLVAISAPPPMCGMLSNQREPPRRRMEISMAFYGPRTHVCFDNPNMGVINGLLARNAAAERWNQPFNGAAAAGNGLPVAASERLRLRDRLRAGEKREAVLSGLCMEDALALRWWAHRADDALDFDAADDAAWRGGATEMLRRGEEHMPKNMAKRGLWHELSLHLSVECSDLIIGADAARCLTHGFKFGIHLDSSGMRVELAVEGDVAIDARAEPDNEMRALIRGAKPPAASPASEGPDSSASGLPAPQAEVLHVFHAELVQPADFPPEGRRKITIETAHCVLCFIYRPILGTLLHEFLGACSAAPDASLPSVDAPAQAAAAGAAEDSCASGKQSARPPVGFLSGMPLKLQWTMVNCQMLLPSVATSQTSVGFCTADARAWTQEMGIVLRASRFDLRIDSSATEELIGVSVDGSAIVLSGTAPLDEELLLQPMERIEAKHHTTWSESKGGALRHISLAAPRAKIAVSPVAVRVGGNVQRALLRGRAPVEVETELLGTSAAGARSENSVTASMEAENSERADDGLRLRKIFEEIDADQSGELQRGELFKLTQRLCSGSCPINHFLTQRELHEGFDDLWEAMDVTNDGAVSFHEFCRACTLWQVQPDDVNSADARTYGPLSLAAVDLHCQDVVAHIGDEDSSEDRLWAHLLADVAMKPVLGGGGGESHAVLQWKLFRSLRNYASAEAWWSKAVQKRVAPGHAWQIDKEVLFHRAAEVAVAAFSGHVVDAAVAGKLKRNTSNQEAVCCNGIQLSVFIEGYEIELADALSDLHGWSRLTIHLGTDADPTIDVSLCYWHMGGAVCPHFGETDELDGHFRLRGLSGVCLNPCHRRSEPFLESWSVDAEVRLRPESGHCDRSVVVHLVSDQHLVFNLSSSLILAIKPLVQSLCPEEEEEMVQMEDEDRRMCTTPLDHLLQARADRDITRDELIASGLLRGDEGWRVGVPVPGEKPWKGNVDVARRATRIFKSSSGKVTCSFDLPMHLALVRFEVIGYDILQVSFQDGLRIHVIVLATDAHAQDPTLAIFVVDRVKALFGESCHLTRAECRSSSIRTKEKPHKMQSIFVVNYCGQPGKVTYERTSLTTGCWSTLDEVPLTVDAKPIQCPHPGAEWELCLHMDGYEEVLRPNLTTIGRCALRLKHRVHSSLTKQGSAVFTSFSSLRMPTQSLEEDLCLIAELSINRQGHAVLELFSCLELHNSTCVPLQIEIRPPERKDGQPTCEHDASVRAVLAPEQGLRVPLPALFEFGWIVQTSGAITHAFVLQEALLLAGWEETQTRHSLGLALQTRSIALLEEQHGSPEDLNKRGSANMSGPHSGGSAGSKASYRTLLILPGLRILNALPLPLQVSVTKGSATRADTVETIDPGAATDIGLVARGLHLEFAAPDGTSCKVDIPAGALATFKEFEKLAREFSIGKLQCVLHCNWSIGRSPEFTVYGRYMIFDKTGLSLRVRCSEKDGQGIEIDEHAVLGAQDDKLQVSLSGAAAPDLMSFTTSLPEYHGCFSVRVEKTTEFAIHWVEHSVDLADGTLKLKPSDNTQTVGMVRWKITHHTYFTELVPSQAGGESHALQLDDPGQCRPLVFRTESHESLHNLLKQLRATVDTLRHAMASEEMRCGWDVKAHGPCICAPLPAHARGEWSLEVPVQAPGEGEVAIQVPIFEDDSKRMHGNRPDSMESLYLGVQVKPCIGAFARSVGITFTPRFVIKNHTGEFIQALPALLPPDMKHWPARPLHASLATARRREQKGSFSFASTKRHEDEAEWVAPGSSLALFHFPRWCSQEEVATGRKTVALRLRGGAPLEVISAANRGGRSTLPLHRVGAHFMPYRDSYAYCVSLPSALGALAKDGRLHCLRGTEEGSVVYGDICVTVEAQIFVAVRADKPCAQWLLSEPWQSFREQVSVQSGRNKTTSLRVFHRQVGCTDICVDGAGEGSVVIVARLPAAIAALDASRGGAGLPWSEWVSLDIPDEQVLPLQTAEGSRAEFSFVRCSVQVELSTVFLVLSCEAAPYRAENYSPTRKLAVSFVGSKEKYMLPPLSWWAFKWPADASEPKKLIVEDVSSGQKETYDTEHVGSGKYIDLRDKRPVTGMSAPLNEQGYRAVIQQHNSNTREMADFARRVASELGGGFADRDASMVFARRFSGEESSQSFSTMRAELIAKGLVPCPSAKLTQAGFIEAQLCARTMVNFVRGLLAAGGLAAEEDSDRAIAHWFEQQATLQGVINNILTVPGAREGQPTESAYKAACNRGDAVGIHICLLRELGEAAGNEDAALFAVVLAETVRMAEQPRPWKEAFAEFGERCGAQRRMRAQSAASASSTVVASAEGQNSSSQPDNEPQRNDCTRCEDAAELPDIQDLDAIAMSEPLSSDGYARVLRLGSIAGMAVFVRRVIRDQGAEISSAARLVPFCAAWCKSRGQTFLDLRAELVTQGWVHFGEARCDMIFENQRFDGVTKVFAFSESEKVVGIQGDYEAKGLPPLEYWDIDVQLAGVHARYILQPAVHALGTGEEATGTEDEETVNATWDHFHIRKEPGVRKIQVEAHHWQIDNMRETDKHNPIILCPPDSGFNSSRRDDRGNGQSAKVSTPFLRFVWDQVPSRSILHLRELEVVLQPFILRFDMVFWMEVGSSLLQWMPTRHSGAEDAAVAASYVQELCEDPIDVPVKLSRLSFAYIERLHIGKIMSQVELLMPLKGDLKMGQKDDVTTQAAEHGGKDSAMDWGSSSSMRWLTKVAARLSSRARGRFKKTLMKIQFSAVWMMQSVGAGVLSGIGHVTPAFYFAEWNENMAFGDINATVSRISGMYVKRLISQWFKVLFSTNILGDPIGYAGKVTGGFYEFARKTGHGEGSEGAKALMTGVVGGGFGVMGKIAGALGDTVDALAHTSDARPQRNIGSMSDGLVAGVSVFGKSMASGVGGVVMRPYEGAKKQGLKGFGTGIFKGVGQLVAKPVSGLMHGVQHIAAGAESMTQLLDSLSKLATRRAPQPPGKILRPLIGAEFVPMICVFIERITWGQDQDKDQLLGDTFCLKVETERRKGGQNRFRAFVPYGQLLTDGVAFSSKLWVPCAVLCENDLQIIVEDYSLRDADNSRKAVYRCMLKTWKTQSVYKTTLNAQAPLPSVADLLRRPAAGSLTRRLRPAALVKEPLAPEDGSIGGAGGPQISLSFWPAWDRESVPALLRWHEPDRAPPRGRADVAPPPRWEGWLEKKTEGSYAVLHHWSPKWVVLQDGVFMYWNEQKHCAKGDEPRVREVLREDLKGQGRDPQARTRFGAGNDPGNEFVEVQLPSGRIEARWRPSANEKYGGRDAAWWLQAILSHAVTTASEESLS